MQILEGHFSADDSARLCRNYRYASERMTRIMAGWIALTPELSAKLLLGRHVWDNAQHADAWGRRLPELRAHAQESRPPNEAFVRFMDAIEAPEEPGRSADRLAGIYRVLKPHLLAVYEGHRRLANPVYEPPTCRILDLCVADERRHIEAGETIIRHLAPTPEIQSRLTAWQAELQSLLAAAAGVTGAGLPPVAPPGRADVPLSDDPREFIKLEHAGQKWSIPEDLETALGAFGDALVAGDPGGRGHFLDLEPRPEGLDALGEDLVRHSVVAFAKLGHHRLVKYRLEGRSRSVIVNTRWERRERGWGVGALDLVRIEHHPPA
jgi:PAS domain-containing protein